MDKYIASMIVSYSLFMSLIILATKGITFAILWMVGNFTVSLYGMYLNRYVERKTIK